MTLIRGGRPTRLMQDVRTLGKIYTHRGSASVAIRFSRTLYAVEFSAFTKLNTSLEGKLPFEPGT
jgi:hypothetical protein